MRSVGVYPAFAREASASVGETRLCFGPSWSSPAPTERRRDALTAVAVEALEVSDPSVPLPIALPSASDPLLTGLTIPADAPTKGMWSPTQPWPLNGLHSVLLPNGRVLTYGTPTGQAATQDGRYFDVWDPTQGFATLSHRTSFRADR